MVVFYKIIDVNILNSNHK